MKKIGILISSCFAMILVTSCATVRAGYCGSSDRSSYNSSYSSIVNNNEFSKSSSKSAASSGVLSESNTVSRSGIFIGVHFEDIELSESLDFEPGINFLLIKDDLNQIHVPLMISYNLTEDLDVKAGPSLGYLIDDPAGVKSTNFGLDFGASYNLSDKFSINAGYNLGLSDISENDFTEIKISNFLIGLGYKL